MFFLKFPMMGSSRFLADFGALMQRRLKNDNIRSIKLTT